MNIQLGFRAYKPDSLPEVSEMNILSILLAHTLTIFIFNVGSVVTGILLKQKIEEFNLFTGPSLLQFQLFGVPVHIRPLPLGGSVKFAEDQFKSLGILSTTLMCLSGPLMIGLAAVAFMPFGETIAMIQSGFLQILWGTVDPFGKAQEYLGQAWSYLNSVPFSHQLTAICAKNLAFNLLPIPGLSGGAVFYNILNKTLILSEKTQIRITTVGLLMLLLIMTSWGIALITFLRS